MRTLALFRFGSVTGLLCAVGVAALLLWGMRYFASRSGSSFATVPSPAPSSAAPLCADSYSLLETHVARIESGTARVTINVRESVPSVPWLPCGDFGRFREQEPSL